MSQTVMADAQFGIAKILRPQKDYLTLYQGKSIWYPILFSEGGEELDPEAGKPGYSNCLAKALPVAYGSRLSIWLPRVFGVMYPPIGPSVYGYYKWTLIWRMRNLYDFRNNRTPFHLPKQGLGQPSTKAGDSGPRVVIPAAIQSVLYSATETNAPTVKIQQVVPEVFAQTDPVVISARPIFNGGAGARGVYGQGVLDPASPSTSLSASGFLWTQIDVQALGDELIVVGTRINDGVYLNWDFATGGMDEHWRLFFTFEMSGVYVLPGTAP